MNKMKESRQDGVELQLYSAHSMYWPCAKHFGC